MNLKENRWFIILYVLAASVVIAGMFVPVMEIDAAQYASISKQMTETGSYLELYNRNLNYLDKPPLLFWISALSIKFLGNTDFAYKLPSVLCSLFGVFGVYGLANIYYGKRAAHIATLMYITSVAFLVFNNDIRTDTLLIAFVIFSVYHLVAYRRFLKTRNFILAFTGIGLAMLAKGPLGLIVVGMAILPDALLKKQWKFIFNPRWLLGILIIAVILAPMCYGLYTQYDANPRAEVNGETGVSGLRFYFWTQSFGRITGDSVWATAYSNNPDTFFLTTTFLWAFLPWTLLYLTGFIYKTGLLIKNRLRVATGDEYITCFGFMLPLLALSSSGYQLNHYIYVVIPFASVLAAQAYLMFEARWNKGAPVMSAAQLIVALSALAFSALAVFYVFKPVGNLYYILSVTISLFLLLLVVLFIRGRLVTRIIFVPALAIIFTFSFLNIYFYPELLVYQREKEMKLAIDRHGVLPARLYGFKCGSLHALDFYWEEKSWVTYVYWHELRDLAAAQKVKDPIWLLTRDEGLAELKEFGYEITELETFDTYPVTQLETMFLNPATRQQSIYPEYRVYLVRVIQP